MLPSDPGPGANPDKTPAQPQYPPPLDFTIRPDGSPSFLAKFGPGFEWVQTDPSKPEQVKLIVSWAIAGGPILHRVLEPAEASKLLEWMLRSAEVRDG